MSSFMTVVVFAMIWVTIEVLQAIYQNEEALVILIPFVFLGWIGGGLLFSRWSRL